MKCFFFFSQFTRDTKEYTPHRAHRSHSAIKLLSPGRIYAGVITKARWQVADRWQIDGLCPWVWTAPTWPVHQKHNNTVGGWCRAAHTDPKPKDTEVLEVSSETGWLLDFSTKEKCKFDISHYLFPWEKSTAISAINILAHKYLWQRAASLGSNTVNACWVRKWGVFQMLQPSILGIWEDMVAAITLCYLSITYFLGPSATMQHHAVWRTPQCVSSYP